MASEKKNVTHIIGNKLTGSVFRKKGGDASAATRTAATDWESVGYEDLGYVDATAGAEFAKSADKTAINAWGRQPIRNAYTNQVSNVTITFLETKAGVLSIIFGDANVNSVNGFTEVLDTAVSVEPAAYAISALTDDGRQVVIFLPEGEPDLSSINIAMNDDNVTNYPITLEALESAAIGGKVKIWIEEVEVTEPETP